MIHLHGSALVVTADLAPTGHIHAYATLRLRSVLVAICGSHWSSGVHEGTLGMFFSVQVARSALGLSANVFWSFLHVSNEDHVG
jgi:hypothetical protein